jgi:hypothetical protein
LVNPLLINTLATVAAFVPADLNLILCTKPPLVVSAVKTVSTEPVPSTAKFCVVAVGGYVVVSCSCCVILLLGLLFVVAVAVDC